MFKKMSLLLICIIFIFGTFLPQSKGMATSRSITIYADTVNIREGPSLSYPLVKQAKKGEKYTILQEKGDWTQIKVALGQTGWVANWLVTKESSQTSTSGNANATAVANTDQLRVRSGPGTSFRIIGVLNKGQAVTILDQNENWYEISFSNQRGWVSTDYINTQTAPKETQNGNNGVVTVTADTLSVRKSADLNAAVIGTVEKGQQFTVLQEENNWVKIEYKPGSYGWAAGWYMDQAAANPSPEKTNNENTVTILQDGSNIRKSPNGQADVISHAKEGDTFAISNIVNDWYEIKLSNGAKGYVAGWIVSVNGTAPNIEKQGPQNSLKNKTIVIDPGHGGVDNGTTGSSGTLEKNLTIKTAKLLYDKLRAAGANVYLTRTDDTYISLPARVSVSRSLQADAFVSLHYDSNTDPNVQGSTGYYYHPSQKSLAETVYTSTINETGLKNRGVRFGDFHVIRENSQKATLIELGYLSNPSEEMTLNSGSFQENAATGVFNGLARFFSSK
ncbi:N-acetylmuramoyl-L-alanine amidase cwlB [Neobacillus massiliamazoniensis]|uniref:N-acetylmuramoyl-L-alanine amidase cwlB n=2 Tax=Neobacillus massiliamazoniensis TaxID=1499688 RepID=A0A0U1P1Y4_9BACI|nr:N-acetylmuramoyl-L-alanine amidase cwlB [Neobacillus massiliamazoniensis]